MQEHKVTVGGQSRALPDPFPRGRHAKSRSSRKAPIRLPEAQLDRFMFSLHLDYPAKDGGNGNREAHHAARIAVAARRRLQQRICFVSSGSCWPRRCRITSLITRSRWLRPRGPAANAPQVARDFVEWGAGPRASQYLILGAKALALLKGKISPETEDVREVALPVLQHRVITNYRATGAGKKSHDIVQSILAEVREQSY